MQSMNTFRVGELIRPIEEINLQLERDFGRFEGKPKYRVVWANDQLEKRWVTHTDEGFELINPEVREVKKYKNDSVDRYVLERLTEIPAGSETDLVTPISYEPVWTFQDRFNNYLPPRFDACKFIIETIEQNIHTAGHRPKVKDPKADGNHGLDEQQREIDNIEEMLFGNETPVTDALHYGSGVSMAGLDGTKKENIH